MFRGFGDRVAIGPELLFSGADLCSGAIRHPHIGMPPGKDEKNWGGLSDYIYFECRDHHPPPPPHHHPPHRHPSLLFHSAARSLTARLYTPGSELQKLVRKMTLLKRKDLKTLTSWVLPMK